MLKISHLVLLGSLSLLSISCATQECVDEDLHKEPGALDVIICSEPRPQTCTQEYDPVCATLKDGSVKTYATGCTSCSDIVVTGYKQGGC